LAAAGLTGREPRAKWLPYGGRVRIRAVLLVPAVVAMIGRPALLVGAAVLAGPAVLGDPLAAAATSSVAFRFADPRIDEASGLAVGVRSPGVVYVQNDSGDSARFFAVDASTGRTVAVCQVPDARNVDWEDLATGPDARRVPSVWLGDIGNNDESRTSITVYRVDEPAVGSGSGASGSGGDLATGRPDVWRLRYPDGPHNAEALFVDPLSHRVYLVTKSLFGRSEVFELPAAPSGPGTATQALSRVGSIDFEFTGTTGGPNLVGQLTATGASMSADGSRLVVRTYTDAYLWPVRGSDVPGALAGKPTRTPLPEQPLGEGIAFGGRGLLIDTEGAGSPVYTVALPAVTKHPPAASSSAAARPTPGATTSQPRPVSAGHNGDRSLGWALASCAVVGAALAGWGMRRVSKRH